MRTRWSSVVISVLVLGVVTGGAVPAAAKGEEPRADQRLLRRDTDGGVTIRADTGPMPDEWVPGDCTGPGCMPEPCLPRGIAIIGLSTNAAVGEGYLEVYRAPSSGLVLAGSGIFGSNVGHPVGWVAVRTGPKTARVEARFDGGGTDSMQPVDGWAVLAARVPEGPAVSEFAPTATVRAEADDGSIIGTTKVNESTAYQRPPDPCPSSQLDAGFPKGTGRAPKDEEQARAEILAAFSAAYGAAPTDDALAFVEDGASIAEVAGVATERYPEYRGKLVLAAEELRFIDVDEAAVRFTLNVKDGVGTLARGVGRAVLRDGAWLVSRATFCSLLALGAVYCPLPDGTKLS